MNNQWFESRGLRVLTYQSEAIAKVQESLGQREITVLAACPSAGKTLMTIYMMEEYLRENPNHKIMVLAHGTTILRTQFHDVLKETKPAFTYNLVEKFTQYDVTADVNICLPQTLAGNVLNKIDLLIVDEAHQFYFAEKMMKDIIKQTKPKKQLLLTGTPSPFIRKGINIVPVTLNTIYDEGMISDLYVEIATSSYTFDPMTDFNSQDELKTDVYIKDSETKKTLDDLVSKIVERLKSIRGNDYQNLLPEWLPTLKRLQKTMIACRSQHQAMQVKHYFDKIGIKSALSISDIDYDSSEIEVFKQDVDCLILIVVGRGILGFNYPELVNVVDMTTSQNVDRIYQLLCRVIRKHPEGQKKLFFKVAPNIHSDYYKYIMTAVLSLSDESFFTKFNGKNFSDMIIPVIKTKKEHHEPNNNGGNGKPRPKTLKPIDFEGLPVFEFFKDLYHKKDALLHVYAYTTVRDVRGEFLDWKPNGYWSKEKCIENALEYKTLKDWYTNNSTVYNIARKNGWLDECIVNLERINNIGGYWTKDRCIESTKNYIKHSDWQKNEATAYNTAIRNGWLEECCINLEKRKSDGYWTKEKCIESALKYDKIIEWQKNEATAYHSARINGWIEECTKHIKRLKNNWTKEKCIESALKYNKLIDWQKNEGGALNAARINDWIEECTAHMEKRFMWTKEKCIESASKYNRPVDWSTNEGGAYATAKTNGWFDECVAHMTIKRNARPNWYWTKEKCIESALKYNAKKDWIKNESGAFGAAKTNGWFDECTKHMITPKKQTKYTKEICIKSALNYNTKKDWVANDGGAFQASKKNGWFEECTIHMKNKNFIKIETI
jgi:superfamily II DNA or RNA helicase